VTPFHERWERDKVVPRAVWLAAGRAGASGLGFLVHNDMIAAHPTQGSGKIARSQRAMTDLPELEPPLSTMTWAVVT